METVNVDRTGGVVTVTLNRPQRKNALTTAMSEELRAVFDAVAVNPDDRVLVLTGAGGDFCSGADLSVTGEPAADVPARERVRRFGDMALSLHRLAKPTIAKVDGVAVGAGLGLAIGCDLVVASERARLSMIFVRRGLSPDCATSWLLPRVVGTAKAKELALLAEVIDAETALSMGLVNRVVAHADLDAAVDDWAFRRYRTSEVVRLLLTAVHLELWYHLMTSVFQVRGQWRYLRQSHVWAPALPRSSWEG